MWGDFMSMFRTVYLVDVGVLLEKDNEAFDSYCQVYDKEWGYFDEDQFYMEDKNKAISFVDKYVNDGVEHTYGVVSKTEMPYEDEDLEDINVEGESYFVDDIVYCVAKLDYKPVEDFIKR